MYDRSTAGLFFPVIASFGRWHVQAEAQSDGGCKHPDEVSDASTDLDTAKPLEEDRIVPFRI
jgi:hypothetical protein